MAIQQAVKQLFLKVMPGPAEALQRSWRRRHQARFEQDLDMPRIAASYTEKQGLLVLSGPFNGMQYISAATGSMFIPKLVGCYEQEIASFIEELIGRNPHVVIDIGCAEGYYAIGLALRLPHAKVVAFDSDPHARVLCQSLAQKNGVLSQVEVRGLCEFAAFETLLQESSKNNGISALVVCDCDGCEGFLLDPAKVPSLAGADVLVETHDHIDASITLTLRKRFAPTHNISHVASGVRDPKMHPEVHFLSLEDQDKALSEYRPPQGWLIMTPKKADAAA